MSNSFYNATAVPATSASLSSATIRAEFAAIAAGFDKMPTLAGNDGKALIVKSGGTAVDVTTGTLTLAGNFATSGTSSLTLTTTAPTNVTLPTSGTLLSTASVVTPSQGGTGIANNNASTLTISGAFATTLTVTAGTTVTLPTTGTLSTLAGSEELTNKTLTASVGKGTWTASGTWTLPALTLGGAVTLSSTLSATSANTITLSPSGAGTVTINPATLGNIDNTRIGFSTRAAIQATTGDFSGGGSTALTVSGTSTLLALTTASAGLYGHIAMQRSAVNKGYIGLDAADLLSLLDSAAVAQLKVTTGGITLPNTLTAAAINASGDFNINSGKFTVAAASGNTVVAGTLGVTGVVTAQSGAGTTNALLTTGTAKIRRSSNTAVILEIGFEGNAVYAASTGIGASHSFGFGTVASFTEQFRITETASATRCVTITGSNGGEAAIGTSAGALSVGTGLQVTGATGATAGAGLELSYSAGVGVVLSFNRTGAAYAELDLNGSLLVGKISGGEAWRTNAGGYFKASNNGTYLGATGTYHEFYSTDNTGNIVLSVKHAGATAANQYGIQLSLSGDPNSTGNYFLTGIGNATERLTLRSNGGLANFSANNVNLSDLTVKPSFERYSEMLLDQLSGALEQVDWGRFKYHDQTHDDWNHGYSAQGVRKAFKGVADELVDLWSEKSDLLAVYHHDLHNIAAATAVHQIKKLKARVAELESRL